MLTPKKTIRGSYWLVSEFIKKNIKLILLTFFLSFIIVIGLVSLYPVLESQFFIKKQRIGIAGKYDSNNLPNEITNKISNGLVFTKSDGSVIPALASTWEINKSGGVFLFHLKQNLIWNNGTKFSAKDINYQFKDVTIQAIDDNTVKFVLKNPLPIFINYLTKPVIKHPLVGVGGLYRTGKLYTKNGFLKEIHLIPNKKGISPIVYKFYDNDNQLVTAYKKGEITEFNSSNKTLVEPFKLWKNSEILISVDYSRLFTLFFNFNNPLLKERTIRAAIKMGIDLRDFKDYGQTANSPIPPTSWSYNNKTKPAVFDSDTAKKIITNSVSSTQSAKLNLVTYYEYSDLSNIIVEKLKSLGLKINLKYLTHGLEDNFDLLLAYWKIPEDPDQYYFWHSSQKGTNIGDYKNLKVDKLLEDGRSSYIIKQRKELYQEFQKVITDDPPAFFLFFPHLYTVKRK